MQSLCRGLVEYRGQLVSRCNPDYLFQGQPLQEILYIGVLLILLCVFIFILVVMFKRLRSSDVKSSSKEYPNSKWRNYFDMVIALVLCFGFFVWWVFKLVSMLQGQ